MTITKWRLALASAGLISLGTAAQAEEGQHQVLTALSQTTLSGYVDTSAIWAPGGPNGAIPGRTFDGAANKLDGFNLHAVKLMLEKPLDEGQWSAGYKADLIFGPDADFYSSANNATGINSDDFAVKQAYVALRAPIGNGLDIKLGVWDTIIGYEVFESVNNPNFSRSYGYYIEPTHHTGVLMTYNIADWISVSGGVANGWTGPVNDKIHDGEVDDGEDRKAFLGSLTLTLPESAGLFAGSAIYAGIVYGNNTAAAGGIGGLETTSYYLGATVTTGLEGLTAGAALDYRDDGNLGMDSSHASTFALYLSFQATEKLKLNGRVEYATGSNGTWYTVDGADDNELGALTLTVDYSLWANVVTRGEVRYDKNLGGDDIYHGSDMDDDALTLTANLVYKF